MLVRLRVRMVVAILLLVGGVVGPASAAIRVMSYNVDADTDRDGGGYGLSDGTFNTSSVTAVVQAVAKYTLAGNAQAPDVISLQELYASPAVTLSSYVSALNTAFAGTGVTYAYDTLVGGSSNASLEGNGPNGLIYRVGSIQVLGATNVGTASGSGAARTPVRYRLQSLTSGGANTFYLYGEHVKASAGPENADRRAIETAAVRANANTLLATDPTAHIIYTGDFNLAGLGSDASTRLSTGGSNEQSYQNLVAPGTAAQAFDPLGLSSFTNYSAAQTKYYTESDTSLSRRYDLQLVTGNVLPSDVTAGLHLVANTYTAFGGSYYTANGTLMTAVAYQGTVATAANAAATGISLADLQSLVAATDHLPVIADYTIVAVPEPTALAAIAVLAVLVTRRRRLA